MHCALTPSPRCLPASLLAGVCSLSLLGSPASAAGLDWVPVSSFDGHRTVRVYVDDLDPDDVLLSIFGQASPGRLTIATADGSPFFNAPDFGQQHARPAEALFGAFPSLQWDTWLAIGDGPISVTPGFPNIALAGGGAPIVGLLGHAWFDADFSTPAQPDSTGRVLIAQLTVAAGVDIEFCASIQYLAGGSDEVEEYACVEITAGPCDGTEDGPREIILLDRTGSMNVTPPDYDATLCSESFTAAFTEATVYGLTNPAGLISPWVFSGASPTQLDGFVSPAAAQAALLGEGACGGATPLAESVCAAIDELLYGSCPGPGEELRLFLLTDGRENNSSGECAGPPADPPLFPGDYDLGSWHRNVYDAVLASGVQVDVWYWEDGPIPAMPGHGQDVATDREFFEDLTEATGGYLVYVEWGEPTPPYTGACCLPDGTCAADQTVFACLEAGGTFGGLGSPCDQCGDDEDCQGDLDGDGLVDTQDLLTLLSRWGSGDPVADLAGSGVVDAQDLLLMLSVWGACEG